MKTAFFYFIKWLFLTALALPFPVKLHGRENLPESGGFLICPNHISLLDPVMIVIHNKRRIWFMAKKELFSIPVVGFVVRVCGGFPVDRGRADMAAMRESFAVLKRGEGLGIFPQGTRERAGKTVQMHNGAALIAQRAGAPVLPAFVDGPYKLFRRTHIYIGKPVDLSVYARKYDAETISMATSDIETAIRALKPSN